MRIQDKKNTWRLIYRVDSDAIVIVEVFSKKTQQTPKGIIETSKVRMKLYDELTKS